MGFPGTRISLVYFSSKHHRKMSAECREKLINFGFWLPDMEAQLADLAPSVKHAAKVQGIPYRSGAVPTDEFARGYGPGVPLPVDEFAPEVFPDSGFRTPEDRMKAGQSAHRPESVPIHAEPQPGGRSRSPSQDTRFSMEDCHRVRFCTATK